MKPTIEAIDIFCGVGGLTYGLQKAGIHVLAGVDIDHSCKYPFEINNNSKFFQKDIFKPNPKELNQLYSDNSIKILAGCAPCQPFSSYAQGNRAKKDNKWELVMAFARLIKYIKPDYIVMENVPFLINHSTFKKFIKTLENRSYSVKYEIVNCQEIGIAQTRKRLVLIASKMNDFNIISTHGKRTKTLKETIGNLPEINAGETCQFDKLNTCSNLLKTNLKRIEQSKPGKTWREWDTELISPCHKKSTGATYSCSGLINLDTNTGGKISIAGETALRRGVAQLKAERGGVTPVSKALTGEQKPIQE